MEASVLRSTRILRGLEIAQPRVFLGSTSSKPLDGSKFKAVNTRDKNFTRGKVERRRAQLEESVARYLAQLDTADRQEPSAAKKSSHATTPTSP